MSGLAARLPSLEPKESQSAGRLAYLNLNNYPTRPALI
jgi:hypothetical protein